MDGLSRVAMRARPDTLVAGRVEKDYQKKTLIVVGVESCPMGTRVLSKESLAWVVGMGSENEKEMSLVMRERSVKHAYRK